MSNYKAVRCPIFEDKWNFNDRRYVIVDIETGEILDDAQGYGYKSPQKAYAGYAYKNRDKSKDAEKVVKKKQILAWMKEHKDFVSAMDIIAFEISKGSWGADEKFDAKFVQKMLDERELETVFSAAELLRVWKNYGTKI